MGHPVPEADPLQELGGVALQPPALAPVRPEAMPDQLGHQHVLERGQLGKQMIELEDEAEGAVAKLVALALRDVVDPASVEHDFATIGRVEQPQQMQERALARPARPHHGEHLVPLDVQIDAAEHRNLVFAFPEALF